MKTISWTLAVALASAAPGASGADGGYVGSDRWFSAMRQSAANLAMLRQLGGGPSPHLVPPDYIEVAGVFEFPQGNPFPKGRLPDLRIQCDDRKADGVERAPFVLIHDGAPNFYTVLRKGQSYTFSWMSYFGSKDAFARWRVPASGPRTVSLVLRVDQKGKGRIEGPGAPVRDENGRSSAHENANAQPGPPRPTAAPGSGEPTVPAKPCNPLVPRYSQPGCTESSPSAAHPAPPAKRCDPRVPRYSQPGCVE